MATYAIQADPIAPAPTAATDVRVTLESLPVPLRVAAAELSADGMAFEAELPWLAVGTALTVDVPGGEPQKGWIESFDLEVTGAGAARLRIHASRHWGADHPRKRPRRRRSWSWPVALITGAALGGYAGSQGASLPSLSALAEAVKLFIGGP
jgi:hypothetical protein